MDMLDFGKNSAYIWWSFGLTFVVLVFNAIIAYRSHQRVLREIHAQEKHSS